MPVRSVRQTTMQQQRQHGCRLILMAIRRTNGCCRSPTRMRYLDLIAPNFMPYQCQNGIHSATRRRSAKQRATRFRFDPTAPMRTFTRMSHWQVTTAPSCGKPGNHSHSIVLAVRFATTLFTDFDCIVTMFCCSKQQFAGNARTSTFHDMTPRSNAILTAGTDLPTTTTRSRCSSCSGHSCRTQSCRCGNHVVSREDG